MFSKHNRILFLIMTFSRKFSRNNEKSSVSCECHVFSFSLTSYRNYSGTLSKRPVSLSSSHVVIYYILIRAQIGCANRSTIKLTVNTTHLKLKHPLHTHTQNKVKRKLWGNKCNSFGKAYIPYVDIDRKRATKTDRARDRETERERGREKERQNVNERDENNQLNPQNGKQKLFNCGLAVTPGKTFIKMKESKKFTEFSVLQRRWRERNELTNPFRCQGQKQNARNAQNAHVAWLKSHVEKSLPKC